LAAKNKVIFVVRKCQIEYKIAAKLDDLVEIKTTITKIGAASIAMHQEMFLGEKLLNILECEIVCVASDSMKPKKIPEEVSKKFI
jgi:acyl-CoA thioester hydrolase